MKVPKAMIAIRSIHKANIDNYEKALNDALMAMGKIKKCEEHLKELSLNSYKKYKDFEMSSDEYQEIINSIANITIEPVTIPKGKFR
jgi:hypothetical protein